MKKQQDEPGLLDSWSRDLDVERRVKECLSPRRRRVCGKEEGMLRKTQPQSG